MSWKGKKGYIDPKKVSGPYSFREGKRPNILFISLDMVPPEFYMPGRQAAPLRTPALDSLRKEGFFFSNAFASSPLCTPSRASYLSGRYSYITGNGERGHDGHTFHLRERDPIFPEYLKALGYHLRHVGKCHVGAGRFVSVFGENASPWDRWSPPWYDDDDYLRFLAGKGLERISFDRTIYGRAGSGKGEGNFYGGWIATQDGRPFPREASYPSYLVDRACGALQHWDRRRPFYLQLDFFGPHQPFAIPAGYGQREQEIRQEISLPDSYRRLAESGFRAPWPEPRVYRLYRKNWGLQEEKTALDYRVANQLQFEHLDECLGQLFQFLKEEGLYEECWIFLIADHGEMNADMALIDKGAYLNPKVMRVPLLTKAPASFRSAEVAKECPEPVSLLDLAPTIFEIAGMRTEERLDGISLLPFITGAAARGRPEDKPILFEVWNHVVPNPCIGMVFRSSEEKLCSFAYNAADDQDELYLLGAEEEVINRIVEEESIYAEAVETFSHVLENDPRWFGYSEYFTLEYAERLSGCGDRQLFRVR